METASNTQAVTAWPSELVVRIRCGNLDNVESLRVALVEAGTTSALFSWTEFSEDYIKLLCTIALDSSLRKAEQDQAAVCVLALDALCTIDFANNMSQQSAYEGVKLSCWTAQRVLQRARAGPVKKDSIRVTALRCLALWRPLVTKDLNFQPIPVALRVADESLPNEFRAHLLLNSQGSSNLAVWSLAFRYAIQGSEIDPRLLFASLKVICKCMKRQLTYEDESVLVDALVKVAFSFETRKDIRVEVVEVLCNIHNVPQNAETLLMLARIGLVEKRPPLDGDDNFQGLMRLLRKAVALKAREFFFDEDWRQWFMTEIKGGNYEVLDLWLRCRSALSIGNICQLSREYPLVQLLLQFPAYACTDYVFRRHIVAVNDLIARIIGLPQALVDLNANRLPWAREAMRKDSDQASLVYETARTLSPCSNQLAWYLLAMGACETRGNLTISRLAQTFDPRLADAIMTLRSMTLLLSMVCVPRMRKTKTQWLPVELWWSIYTSHLMPGANFVSTIQPVDD